MSDSNIFLRLRGREMFGTDSTRRSKDEPRIHKVLGRLTFSLQSIVDRLELQQVPHVFLGFVGDNRFLVSYTCDFDDETSVYHLYIWRFNLNSALTMVRKMTLFDEGDLTDHVSHIVMNQWPSMPNKFVVLGYSTGSGIDMNYAVGIQIVYLPDTQQCPECFTTDRGVTRSCARHGLTVKYADTITRPYLENIHYSFYIPGVCIINTGDALVAIGVEDYFNVEYPGESHWGDAGMGRVWDTDDDDDDDVENAAKQQYPIPPRTFRFYRHVYALSFHEDEFDELRYGGRNDNRDDFGSRAQKDVYRESHTSLLSSNLQKGHILAWQNCIDIGRYLIYVLRTAFSDFIDVLEYSLDILDTFPDVNGVLGHITVLFSKKINNQGSHEYAIGQVVFTWNVYCGTVKTLSVHGVERFSSRWTMARFDTKAAAALRDMKDRCDSWMIPKPKDKFVHLYDNEAHLNSTSARTIPAPDNSVAIIQ